MHSLKDISKLEKKNSQPKFVLAEESPGYEASQTDLDLLRVSAFT